MVSAGPPNPEFIIIRPAFANLHMLGLSQSDPLAAPALKARIVSFMQRASTEITPAERVRLAELRSILAPGTQIYIAHTPNAGFVDVIGAALAVRDAGFRAVPHIAVRRIATESMLDDALKRLRGAGMERILLIGGDAPRPVGELSSTLAVLESALLRDRGMLGVDVAGHPQGHNCVSTPVLWQALVAKQAWAQRSGVDMQIVTQFGLSATALKSWQRELAARRIRLAVRAGIAGPAPLAKLAHFALQCGVGASLRALVRNLSAASRAPELAATPDRHLLALQSTPEIPQIIAPHFFAFGGAVQTARWMQRIAAGEFEIDLERGALELYDR